MKMLTNNIGWKFDINHLKLPQQINGRLLAINGIFMRVEGNSYYINVLNHGFKWVGKSDHFKTTYYQLEDAWKLL